MLCIRFLNLDTKILFTNLEDKSSGSGGPRKLSCDFRAQFGDFGGFCAYLRKY